HAARYRAQLRGAEPTPEIRPLNWDRHRADALERLHVSKWLQRQRLQAWGAVLLRPHRGPQPVSVRQSTLRSPATFRHEAPSALSGLRLLAAYPLESAPPTFLGSAQRRPALPPATDQIPAGLPDQQTTHSNA